MILGQLLPIGGGDPIPLLKPRLVIGRRSSCDITLEFPNVSSHHCELVLIDSYWQIRDLNSTNGLKVNDIRVAEKFMFPGDVLTIAKKRFEIQYKPNPNAARPEDTMVMSESLLQKAGLEKRGRPERLPVASATSPAVSGAHAPPKKGAAPIVKKPPRPQKRSEADLKSRDAWDDMIDDIITDRD